jgi:prolipoprotein diacylglyceryltransferase
MSFPVLIPIGAARINPHYIFEPLGYLVGAGLLVLLRRREGDALSTRERWSIVAAALLGAAVGGRLLFWIDQRALLSGTPLDWPMGKTNVGALIGGWIGVEVVKQREQITRPTGDLFAIPLAVGLAIGRIGCFLSGLPDHTYGNPTTLWTGIDLGDGAPRHPTALYESVFLIILAGILFRLRRTPRAPGVLFRVFMTSYLGLRFAIDFIKPEPLLAGGMSAIQWSCLIALAYFVLSEVRRRDHAHA